MPAKPTRPPPDPRATKPARPVTTAATARPGDDELRRRLGEHVRILGLVDLTDAQLDTELTAALEQRGLPRQAGQDCIAHSVRLGSAASRSTSGARSSSRPTAFVTADRSIDEANDE